MCFPIIHLYFSKTSVLPCTFQKHYLYFPKTVLHFSLNKCLLSKKNSTVLFFLLQTCAFPQTFTKDAFLHKKYLLIPENLMNFPLTNLHFLNFAVFSITNQYFPKTLPVLFYNITHTFTAIGGGVLTEEQARKEQERALRRQKLERLVFEICLCIGWF